MPISIPFRPVLRAIGLLLLVAVAAAPAQAQQTSDVTGRVIGPDGNPVASAAVFMQDGSAGVLTDQSGRFRLPGVAVGQHSVLVSYFGLKTDTLQVTVTGARMAPIDVRMELSPIVLAGITVEGERGGQVRSIAEQRVNATFVNVVSADEIGVLPDQNVAEAVQRVSGLTIQTSRGEGRFVSIRGTAPRLNNVTLNGQTLASPGGSRATQLDMLPADMVTGVEVTKAVTPDMDANSVGGSINITTLSAFDRPGAFLFGSVEGMHHLQQVDYLDDKAPFEASITMGRRFGPDESFGFVLGGNASRRDFGVSVLDPDGWSMTGDGYVFPEEIELQVEDNERTRYGLTGSLDFRPSDRTSLSLRGLFTRTQEITSNSEFEFGFEGDLEGASAAGGRYTEGSGELDLSEDDERSTLTSLSLLGDHRLSDALRWTFAGTFTTGKRDLLHPDATFETADESQMGSVFDVSRYFFTITPEHPDFVANPASYPLRTMNFNVHRNRESSGSVSTDVRWDTRLGSVPTYLELGGKLQLRDKTIDTDRDSFAGAGQTTLAQFANDRHYTVQGGYTGFVHGNVNAYTDFAESNRGNAAVMTADPYTTQYETWRQDRDAQESIRAGYLMGGAQLGRLSLTAGARLEQTTTEATRRSVQRQTQARTVTVGQPAKADKTYTHLLPAVVLRLNATDQLVLRAAWTNTLGRPDYDEFATPGSTSYRLTRGRTDVYDGTVVMGNLDLEPYESSNLDASAEYYFTNGGMMGASVFRKRIDNPIYEWSLTERDVLHEGLQFNELVHTQDRNAGAGMLRGIELSWAQPLIFLPKPLDGLGITANIALIDSDVTVPGREDEDLPFFEQSGRVINFVPYYQRGPLELRVAASYRDEYLTEVGEESFEDRYIDERLTWDVSGQYRIPGDRFEVYAQVRNLTNEPEVGYQGVRSRYDLHVLTGRTVAFGLRARY